MAMPDHIHILFGMRPTQSNLSDVMKQVKQIRQNGSITKGFVNGKFSCKQDLVLFLI
ncbi:MAG: transposase [Flavobacteriaceae bacterium]|nr:transposase [Flavobacteriaceae bacterium]